MNDIKRIVKRLLPPIITDAISRARTPMPSPSKPEPPAIVEWEMLPDGWRTRDPKIKGWNVESIIETQKAKWEEFLNSVRGNGPMGVAHESPTPSSYDYDAHNTLMSFAYSLALAAHDSQRISMLDWGGGLGQYYYFSHAFLPGVAIDYHCKDLPLLAKAGRELNSAATFFDNDADCFTRQYDLVYVSGSLHYSENWRETVSRLASVTDRYLFITRLPIVSSAPSFVVVQRPYRYGYDTEYIGWFLNRREFLDHVLGTGMELVREFLINERPIVRNAPEQCGYRGFLFRPFHNGEAR